MVDTSKTNNNADMFETPGQILRLQREKLDLSTQEIAKRIHLDVKIIEAMESDSSEGMPSAIYVRGYLRSYAKIVGADADKIIELYNSDSPPPPPEILPEVKPPSQISSNDKPVKVFTYLITLGLVLLLLIWYQSNFVVEPKLNIEQPKALTSINGVDVTYKVINHPDSWQSPKSNIEEDIDASIAPEPSEQNSTPELATFENQAVETMQITDNNLSSPVLGHGPDTIDMKLTSDSWIEVVDAMNNRLFHNLATAGEEYNLRGTAPFNVLLGFSKGVTLKFNGKPFDIESHSKNGVARFTLPE
jgi:cytoskeleton protein RodZ